MPYPEVTKHDIPPDANDPTQFKSYNMGLYEFLAYNEDAIRYKYK